LLLDSFTRITECITALYWHNVVVLFVSYQ